MDRQFFVLRREMVNSCCSKRVLRPFLIGLFLVFTVMLVGCPVQVLADCDPFAVMLTLPETKQLVDVSEQLRSDGPLDMDHHTQTGVYSRRWQGATSLRSLSIIVTIHPTVKVAADEVKSYGEGLLKSNEGQIVSLGDLGYRTNRNTRRIYFKVHKGRFVVSYYTFYPGRKGKQIDIPIEEATIREILAEIGKLPCFSSNNPPPPPPPNNCPSGAKLSISPAQPLPTDTITLTGKATDADGDKLTYSWRLSDFNDKKIQINWKGAQNTWKPPGPGRYKVHLTVSDGICSTTSGVRYFTVVADPNRPNSPPVIQLTAKPNPAQVGQEVVFTAVVSDPDGDPVGGAQWWAFKLFNVGNPIDTRVANTFIRKEKYKAGGKGSMTFKVKDVRGAAASSKTVQVVVTDPTQALTVNLRCDHPEYSICRIKEGGRIVFTAVANNSKQDPLTYSWSIDDKRVNSWQGSHAVWKNVPASIQYKITVQVWKKSGETATDDIYLEVDPAQPPPPVNNKPKVLLACSTASPVAGKAVAFKATLSDPDGDKLTWRWSLDGKTVGWSGLTPVWNNATVGTHSVKITVSDGIDTVSDTKTFTVQAPATPPPPGKTTIIQSAEVVDHANGSVWGGNPKSKWQAGEEIGLQIDIKPISRPHGLEIVWLDSTGIIQKREKISLSTTIAGGQGQTIRSSFQSNSNDAVGTWTVEIAVDGLLEKTLNFSLDLRKKRSLSGSATGGATQPASNWKSVF